MRTETVAEAYATYRAHVLPRNAPDVQVLECQRAFYAGVWFLLTHLAGTIGDPSTPEEEGIVELEKLKAECEAFGVTGGMPRPQPVPPLSDQTGGVPIADINYTTSDAATMRPILQDLGGRIGEALPEGWGFNLLLFTYGAGGSLFYISSAERSDVLQVMREFIKRQTQ